MCDVRVVWMGSGVSFVYGIFGWVFVVSVYGRETSLLLLFSWWFV